MANVVSLVLADHQVLLAEGLGMLLDEEDDLVVLGLAHDHSQGVEAVAQHRPVVFIVEADLPGDDLAGTLAAARAASPTTKQLVLAGDAHPETTAAVVASGADGCLAKDRSSRQVATAIRRLAAGDQPIAEAADPPPDRDPLVELQMRTLTPRERAVLELLAMGWSNRRMAQEWRLSYQTVRTHTQSLLIKLGVHSQLEAALFAVEHGVVAPAHPVYWERDSA